MRNFESIQDPTFASSGQDGSSETIESNSLLAIVEVILKFPLEVAGPSLPTKASKFVLKPSISALVKFTGVVPPPADGTGAELDAGEVLDAGEALPEGDADAPAEAEGEGEGEAATH